MALEANGQRHRAVFLDKDGTLVIDVPYNVDIAQVMLAPGVIQGLRMLQAAGYLLIVVSNQSGVARGLFEEEAVQQLADHLRRLLAAEGITLAGFYYCPHHPEGSIEAYAIECECRKPQPGLIRQAAEAHRVDLTTSWMVGDILNDVEAGHRAGCRAVLIDNGNETEWQAGRGRNPDYTAPDFLEAARVICGVENARERAAQRTKARSGTYWYGHSTTADHR